MVFFLLDWKRGYTAQHWGGSIKARTYDEHAISFLLVVKQRLEAGKRLGQDNGIGANPIAKIETEISLRGQGKGYRDIILGNGLGQRGEGGGVLPSYGGRHGHEARPATTSNLFAEPKPWDQT